MWNGAHSLGLNGPLPLRETSKEGFMGEHTDVGILIALGS